MKNAGDFNIFLGCILNLRFSCICDSIFGCHLVLCDSFVVRLCDSVLFGIQFYLSFKSFGMHLWFIFVFQVYLGIQFYLCFIFICESFAIFHRVYLIYKFACSLYLSVFYIKYLVVFFLPPI